MPRQITCASALPGKMRKHENHNWIVLHTVHLCAVFLKEKIAICDVFDSV